MQKGQYPSMWYNLWFYHFRYISAPTGDGSKPIDRTLCVYNIPEDRTETDLQAMLDKLSPDTRLTMAVDSDNIFKGWVIVEVWELIILKIWKGAILCLSFLWILTLIH